MQELAKKQFLILCNIRRDNHRIEKEIIFDSAPIQFSLSKDMLSAEDERTSEDKSLQNVRALIVMWSF